MPTRYAHQLYDEVEQSCLRRAEGKYSEALILKNVSYFDYYYMLMNQTEYFARMNEEIKGNKTGPE